MVTAAGASDRRAANGWRCVVVAALAIVASCSSAGRSGGERTDDPPPPATSPPVIQPPVTSPPVDVVPPPTGADTTADDAPPTLDDQIEWVLATVNGAAATEDDLRSRFAPGFLGQVPPDTLLTVLAQLTNRGAAWTVSGTQTDGVGAEVRLRAGDEPWLLQISVDDDGLIDFLLFQPDSLGDAVQPTTFDELVAVLQIAGDVSLLAADVGDGTCVEVHAVDPTTPRPIGSSFKLYVLGALLDAIAAGDVAWDDALVIRNELKSLPSGTFQHLAAGTERTVGEFALAMISTSDNTATDHLIDLLGRERVEAAQVAYGHSDPALNEPWLTTREFFALKLAVGDEDRAAFVAAGPAGRREILQTVVAETDVAVDDAEDWVAPRAIEEIEYFASPLDLCRAMVALHADADQQAAVREILGANPGVQLDGATWSYVGFKGGSEPGVLSLVWYLEGEPGTYVYVVNVTNDAQLLNEAQLGLAASLGFDFLAAP